MLQPGQWTYSIDRLADVDGYELYVRGVRLSDCHALAMRRVVRMDEMGGISAERLLELLRQDARNCAERTEGISGESVHPSDGM